LKPDVLINFGAIKTNNMRKLFNLTALAAAFFVTSCTRQVSTPSGNNNSSNSTIVTGNFAITRFTDNGSSQDKSADFDGYSFQFTADGKIVATGSTSEVGTYSEKPSHEGEGAKLAINFSSQPLKEISKTWLIITISDTEIDLRDDDAASNEALRLSAL